ncbi:Hsp20/alpha crystallin family protein [Saccharophagus sp. K07]|jgi:HSP20 family molecular chaperone IbpA|uniref:Hsp20/alpha crystallin family protein n=1 Tax=Saccharophagus sp. K07 TaxID=2283636 RepID=UPI0016529455|nr:Hsp20 family protein [Saccharophagus sp. K07]MBC6906676.1 Hsp20/alpha crystallin family protein [Saccharophagus sp. K07]
MSRRRIDHIVARMGTLVSGMQTLHFRYVQHGRGGWEPLMNVYRYPDHYEICVELAGVAPGDLQIIAGGRRVAVSGVRRWPDLRCQRTGSECHRTTLMEIEEGEFWREIELPEEIDGQSAEVLAQQGLVWIRLQLK